MIVMSELWTHFRFRVSEEVGYLNLTDVFTFYKNSLPLLTSARPLFKCLNLSVGVSNAETGSCYDSQMKEKVIWGTAGGQWIAASA